MNNIIIMLELFCQIKCNKMASEEKKRFTLLIETSIYQKFKELAESEERTAGNLGTKLIKDYVKENYGKKS